MEYSQLGRPERELLPLADATKIRLSAKLAFALSEHHVDKMPHVLDEASLQARNHALTKCRPRLQPPYIQHSLSRRIRQRVRKRRQVLKLHITTCRAMSDGREGNVRCNTSRQLRDRLD